MLIDEIDTMMKGDAELREVLRGLINSGFDRAGARFIKNVPTPAVVVSSWRSRMVSDAPRRHRQTA
jgi:hypothetical protein